MSNTLGNIAGAIGGAIQTIDDILDDAQSVSTLVNALGWQMPPGVNDIGLAALDITDLVSKIEAIVNISPDTANDEVEMITRVGELIVSIGKTIKDIENSVNNLQATLNGDYINKTNILEEFIPRLLQLMVGSYLEGNYRILASVLKILGIIEYTKYPKDDSIYQVEHIRTEIRFDRIPKYFSSDIKDLPQDIYGWGTPDFKYEKLLVNFNSFFQSLGSRTRFNYMNQDEEALMLGRALTVQEQAAQLPQVYLPFIQGLGWDWTEIGLLIYSLRKSSDTASDGGIGMMPVIQGDITVEFDLSQTAPWKMKIETEFDMKKGIAVKFLPNSAPEFDTSFFTNQNSVQSTASVLLTLSYGNDTDDINILKISDDLKLVCKQFYVSAGIAYDGDFEPSIEFGLKKGVLSIGGGNGDGFLSKILPDGFKVDFDLGAGWAKKRGVYFTGSGGLEIKLPAHISLGPIEIQGLTLSLTIKDGKIPISAGADIKAALGPLVAVVQNIGVSANIAFPSDHKGNLGSVDVSFGFKPPNGVGLSIDTGFILGAGFLYLDFDKGEYYGALELEVEDLFSLKAIGIINTILPDGSKGFSMLIIITADFTPIQLGFGFTLNGVGGLLGVNRTTMIDVLREGVKTNAIKSVLFPEDVVANISRIISDIKQIFPPFEGHYIIGPMAELGWGSIITLEIGILIEIPDPRIAILGVIRAIMPDEDAPILKIQINFLGVIDFENKYISFDASLYDSNLLIFTLTGDMAFRLSWGDNPFFLLSVGGFHPAFKDAPPDLQHMVRLGISLLANDYVKVSITAYFAVTSNTVQFGAKLELFAGSASSFNIYGYLGFDVLFQFDPFKFIADIYAGLALRSGTSVLLGISVSGELSGPTPWDVKGEASISILFFTISISFHETWGDEASQDKQKIDILDILSKTIDDNRNWTADIPDNNSQHVSIKTITPGGNELVIHPFGALTFSERIVPLGIDITKFGNDLPKDANHFDIVPADNSLQYVAKKEPFAPANFFDLKDNEKLSTDSFQSMLSGFSVTSLSSLVSTTPQEVDVDYRLTYLRKVKKVRKFGGRYSLLAGHFNANIKAAAASLGARSYAKTRVSPNSPDNVEVSAGQWAVANKSDLQIYSGTNLAGSYTEAEAVYKQIINNDPGKIGSIQIVQSFELNSN